MSIRFPHVISSDANFYFFCHLFAFSDDYPIRWIVEVVDSCRSCFEDDNFHYLFALNYEACDHYRVSFSRVTTVSLTCNMRKYVYAM